MKNTLNYLDSFSSKSIMEEYFLDDIVSHSSLLSAFFSRWMNQLWRKKLQFVEFPWGITRYGMWQISAHFLAVFAFIKHEIFFAGMTSLLLVSYLVLESISISWILNVFFNNYVTDFVLFYNQEWLRFFYTELVL